MDIGQEVHELTSDIDKTQDFAIAKCFYACAKQNLLENIINIWRK